MDETGLYRHQYTEFWKRRDEASENDFGKAPIGNVPPPTVRFSKPLRWWSGGRTRRVHALLNIQDQRQAEILRLGTLQRSRKPVRVSPRRTVPIPFLLS
jgi:hypothetical protein